MSGKIIPVKAIDEAIEAAGPDFDLNTIPERMGYAGDDDLLRRVERIIDGDDRFFRSADGRCTLKSAFFEGIKFAVTPEKWEIDEGVLFPASRLAPFLSMDVFPSDAEIRYQGKALPKREITLPLSEAVHYCLLLGAEQIPDYLEADSEANSGLRRNSSPTAAVTLTVFDFSAFYRENRFIQGDAVLFRILDREEGIFECEYRSANNRSNAERKQWIADFEEALRQVEKKFRNYLEIPDQLAWAFYFGGSKCGSGAASLDEFMELSELIEIRTNGDHATLAFIDDEEEQEDTAEEPANGDLPEGLSISSGETSDFGKLLKEIGSGLTPAELDGFILDNCAARDLEFDRFFARAFPHSELKYADEAQEAVFRNCLEERFEELTGHYDRVDDEGKAPLRASIMELVEDRLNYLAEAASDDENSPKRPWKRLSEIYLHLNEILKQLNSERYMPSDSELDKIQEMIEHHTDELETLMGDSF